MEHAKRPAAPASAGQTARARARAELTREIKEEARRQLAAEGAQRLSLRAVARELGMVSSALYRYFPSRDDLLTALIIDAYNALGAAAEEAAAQASAGGFRRRWHACAAAARGWAIAHPHEYALIYGSPVPGYQAPAETIAPAGRVALVLGALVADAWQAAPAALPAPPPLPGQLAAQAKTVADIIAPGVPGPVVARALIAWTQLFGMISFELFGQLVGSADPADDFFGYAVDQMADLIGLPA
ncbi:MAG TPA: TetR/AcrR family transcriptional regulator [Streptosporangiaceae bacterium]|jgi:AcrR family transcriptional regulator